MEYNDIPKDILPTLVVGLGGTGFQVIKRLKKLFAKRYSGQKLPVRYLIIDTDLKSFLDDEIENNEKCQLRFNEGVKATLDWAYSNDNFGWLPENPKITPDFFTSTDQGAGLMRPIGRLYLCKNSKLVYDTLNSAKNDLVDLYKILTDIGSVYLENIDRHKVYIVGSLAGGTGCGTFLDVAVMLSKIFNRDNTNLIGMFTLESCYDDKLSSDSDAQNRSKANCYAALKELEFYMSAIKNPQDERYRFKYNSIGDIKLEKKLLDICYLVENRNEIGGVLTNIEDIYDLCSLQLFQEVGTKLGSQLRADYANFICKDKDPILNRDRHFSTFSSSSMEIPVENIKSYCKYKLAADILESLQNKRVEENSLNVEELMGKLDTELSTRDYLSNFKNLRLTNNSEEAIKNCKNSLTMVEKRVKDKKNAWQVSTQGNSAIIGKIIKKYINEKSIEVGLDGMSETLIAVVNKLRERGNSLTTTKNSGTAADIIKEIEGLNNYSNRQKKSKSGEYEDILLKLKNKINSYLNEKANDLDTFIYKSMADLVSDTVNEENINIDILKGKIHNYNNKINRHLQRIYNQATKSYGGNIIAREMVSDDFYSRHYEQNYRKILTNIIKEIFEEENIREVFKEEREVTTNLNILTILKDGTNNLLKLCRAKVEKEDPIYNKTIIEILRENAAIKEIDKNLYMKQELEITTKLARPFWTALKNPEVSWTECYYIGAVKDDNITNGFTIKPHEEIDNWIRNQTGERSRQARYVETTNPYAIDVIHITMGACAGYLPDIKNYKQFYLKLLSEKTYPLHLNEIYIGLDDLDIDTEKLFKDYTLALAYGAILKIHGNYIYNLSEGGRYFTYKSPYCLHLDTNTQTGKKLPKNISEVDEGIILGSTQREVLDAIVGNKEISRNIVKFLKEIEKTYTEEETRYHKKLYMEAYMEYLIQNEDEFSENKNNVDDGDFIAFEKLRYQEAFR